MTTYRKGSGMGSDFPPTADFPSAVPDPAQGRPYHAGSAASAAGYAAAASKAAHSAAAATPAAARHDAAACCAASAGACRAASAGACRAASAAACRAAACCAASAASAAAAAACCNLQDFARLDVLLVEDIERRQADVRDFLLAEKDYGRRGGVLRRCIRGRSC
jgi:hypothetical protein